MSTDLEQRIALADELATYLNTRGCTATRRGLTAEVTTLPDWLDVMTPQGTVTTISIVWAQRRGRGASVRAAEIGAGYGLRTQAYFCDGPVDRWGAKVLGRLLLYVR